MELPKRQNRLKSRIPHNFSLMNLLGDPFGLATISVALLSWIITLVGSIASAADSEPFPRFTWWGIAFQFVNICLLIIFYIYDLVDYYREYLVGSTAITFVYNTNSATNLVYSDGSRKAAASAGVILLSIVNFIWLFYYGGDNASPVNRWIDSFSLNGIKPSPYEHSKLRARRRLSSRLTPSTNNNNPSTGKNQRYTSGISVYNNSNGNHYNNADTGNSGNNINNNRELPQGNYVSSTALNGFENTDPTFNHQPSKANHDSTFISRNTLADDNNPDTMMSGTLGLYSEFGDEDEDNFLYSAKALYSYDADPHDHYEISFEQGEILKVTDIEGRWWKARRVNGDTGIIPSNYVELIDDH